MLVSTPVTFDKHFVFSTKFDINDPSFLKEKARDAAKSEAKRMFSQATQWTYSANSMLYPIQISRG